MPKKKSKSNPLRKKYGAPRGTEFFTEALPNGGVRNTFKHADGGYNIVEMDADGNTTHMEDQWGSYTLAEMFSWDKGA